MKVTLASLDLFHIANQARYLQSVGVLHEFFCSRLRPSHEGISAEFVRNSIPLHYALRVMQRWPAPVGGNEFYLRLCRTFDRWLSTRFSPETDILTVLSGVGLRSIQAAKKSGIVTVVDCGSTHTDAQHEIVAAEYERNGLGAPLFPKEYRDRVREEFSEADYIQLPSEFVIRTFLERGVSERKILKSPYGVDLTYFYPERKEPRDSVFRVVCPSGVNLRKGARLLAEAWRQLAWNDAELHWIGFPSRETKHLFPKPLPGLTFERYRSHSELAALYRQCDVLVLPSFEEGLARVLLEGAASGLPIIATPNSGVEDFFSPSSPEGWLIPVNDVDSLCNALTEAKQDRARTAELGMRAAERAQQFTWDAYGQRVLTNYMRVLDESF
jgi:glycosyltransferase involved in cell wall biosynthesis